MSYRSCVPGIGIIEAGKMVTEGSLDEIFKELGLKRVVHVQVAEPSEDLLEKIKAIPGVESVEQQIDRLAIRVREDLLSIEDLHDEVHACGARIRMFQPEAMDMETAFMKLTEGKTA